jgi:ABC-2 type transport system permease protein
MSADATVVVSPISASGRSRLMGLGSVYGKTLRDSRRSMLIVAGFLSVMWLVSGAFISSSWPDEATRAEGVALTTALPAIFTGLYGGPAIAPETLGGFTNWRYGLLFFLLPGVWSLMALSGTLVSEVRRGSMDFLATTSLSRRQIATAKLGAHVTAMTIAMLVVGLVSWMVSQAFGTLPGDAIALVDALGYVLLMGLAGLAAGTLAFALAPFLGRGGAAGVAALVLVGGWLANGFRESVPVLDAISPLSWFTWTAGHRPIAGISDYPSLVPLAIIVVVASAVGVAAFVRRDLGDVGAVRLPAVPRWILGISGPLARAFGERFPAAVAWGLGIGLYALLIGSSSGELAKVIEETPSLAEVMRLAFPNVDIGDPGFALQLMFVQIGTLFIGFAAAALVGGWASDESDGRLELLLTTPVSRARWHIASGLGTYLGLVLVSAIVALAASAGVAMTGGDPADPFVGSFVLVLYGTAMAGIGAAVGGLVRPSLAAPAVVVTVVGLFLIELLAPILDLPEWVADLALSTHFGQPMVGSWDPVGIVASAVLAIGGLAIGAWGFSRRDLRT